MVRGILKYGLYLLIGAWMFALGVVVGRGTSPVTFDTASFQEQLRVIVGEIPKPPPEEEKEDLEFFTALNQPAASEPAIPVIPAPEPPAPEIPTKVEKAVPELAPGDIPVKQSRKTASLKQKDPEQGGESPQVPSKSQETATRTADANRTEAVPPAPRTAAPEAPSSPSTSGGYTIQVAAYRAFNDAVSQMSLLSEKGFSSYRTRGTTKDGNVWYRVRTGAFKDYRAAQAELDRLRQARINGMIIKKDE